MDLMTYYPLLVEMIDIHKWFGGVHALKGVNFSVGKGEVVGLVGDNGAGKSTLIKILSGCYKPDHGKIVFEGVEVQFKSPADARRLGIETVYQDQALCSNLNVPHNIFLGRERTKKLGFLNKHEMLIESTKLLGKLGLNLKNLDMPVEFLSGGEKQCVAIARSLYFNAKLVIMDEPTSALSLRESQRVLEFIKRLKENDVSVIIISHNLHHVFPAADRIVVLSKGRKIADIPKDQVNIDEVAQLIISG